MPNAPYVHPMLDSILEVCRTFPIGVGYDLMGNPKDMFRRIEAQIIYEPVHEIFILVSLSSYKGSDDPAQNCQNHCCSQTQSLDVDEDADQI